MQTAPKKYSNCLSFLHKETFPTLIVATTLNRVWYAYFNLSDNQISLVQHVLPQYSFRLFSFVTLIQTLSIGLIMGYFHS